MSTTVLNTKSTYTLLQSNAATHAAFATAGQDQGEATAADVKCVVKEVCEMEKYKDVRVTRLSVDDLLALLGEFNSRGVHFA